MKTIFTLFVVGIFTSIFCFKASAQLNYLPAGFSTSVGTYTDLTGVGTPIVMVNNDDAYSAVLPIGFSFNFNGAMYDSFIVSTNGFIKLGTILPSRQFLFTTFAQPPANGPFSTTTTPAPFVSDSSILFAFGQDLIADSLSNPFSFAVSGSAGTRVCTIQWRNMKDKLQNATIGLYDTINFQVKLYEGSNIVEYAYGNWSTTIVSASVRFAAVGLVGRNMTTLNQNLHLVKGSTVGWGSSVAVTGFYANNAVNYRNPISSPAGPAPGTGRLFTFVPLALNDAAVNAVYTQGKIALPYYNPEPISASISNPGINNLINVPVTLNITGANTYTNTVIIPSLLAGLTATVTFPAYTPLSTGATLVNVSVPTDDNNLNNQRNYSMSVNNRNMAYFDTLAPLSGSNGITVPNFWGCKYFVSGRAVIKQVRSFLVINADATGDTVCGMILDSTGRIIARSPNYIVQPADAGTTLIFNIPSPPYIQNKTIIGGIAGGTSINGLNYFLGSSQTETPLRPNNPFYFLTQTGASGITNAKPGDLWATPGLTGNQATRLMMETVVDKIPDVDVQITQAAPINGLKVPTGVSLPLTAIIKNLGLLATTDTISVRYSINGGTITGPRNFTASILPDDTASVVFSASQSLNFSTAGTYTIKIWTSILNDEIRGNDTLTMVYQAIPPTTLPYRIDNGIFANWTILNSTPQLLYNASATQANGIASTNVLMASNITTSNVSARALSPIFNLTGVLNPVLYFNLSHSPNTFTGTDDTLQVEISLNGGRSFTPIYTLSSQLSSPRLGTTTATSAAYTPVSAAQWRYEALDLSAYAGNPLVLIAFRFKSQSGNNVYINNISVSNATNKSVQSVGGTGLYSLDNASIIFSSVGATGGMVTFSRYNTISFSNASPVYAPNTVAITNNASVFTPNNVSNNSWFAIAYNGVGTGNLDSSVGYFLNYDITGLNGISNLDSLYILRRKNYSSPWVALSTSVSASVLTTGPIYGFGDFTIGSVSTANVLPVSWLQISAMRYNSELSKIEWTTASEWNNDYFEIEKSLDNEHYALVKTIQSKGNSNTIQFYNWFDIISDEGNNPIYYRIKQVDKDGEFNYSKVVQLNPLDNRSSVSAVNPMIAFPIVTIHNVNNNIDAHFQLMDNTGNTIYNATRKMVDGENQFRFTELKELEDGIYFLRIVVDNETLPIHKLLKTHE